LLAIFNNLPTRSNNEVVGNYIADIIVNDKVILEIKAIKELSNIHEVQLVNYLKTTGIEVGLIDKFWNFCASKTSCNE
jgi:GxxExxY protein